MRDRRHSNARYKKWPRDARVAQMEVTRDPREFAAFGRRYMPPLRGLGHSRSDGFYKHGAPTGLGPHALTTEARPALIAKTAITLRVSSTFGFQIFLVLQLAINAIPR